MIHLARMLLGVSVVGGAGLLGYLFAHYDALQWGVVIVLWTFIAYGVGAVVEWMLDA